MQKLFTTLLIIWGAPLALIGKEPASLWQNAHWDRGKAECNFYTALRWRYGELHRSEVRHLFVSEPFDPIEGVKQEGDPRKSTLSVIKLNQIVTMPTGAYLYQQMSSHFWARPSHRIIQFSFTSNDSCGNTYKIGKSLPGRSNRWRMEQFTYWQGMARGEEQIQLPAEGIFRDALPLWIRAQAARGESAFPQTFALITPTLFDSKKNHWETTSARATLRRESDRDRLVITLFHEKGFESFCLEEKFPHRILRWDNHRGEMLLLRESLWIDYWNYQRPGDDRRARAEGNPFEPQKRQIAPPQGTE